MTRISPLLRPALPPAAIVLIVVLAFWLGPALPPSLAGLKEAGAYFVLLAGAAMSLGFNRGRAFVAAGSLLLAYAGYRMALDYGDASFAARSTMHHPLGRYLAISRQGGPVASLGDPPPEVSAVATTRPCPTTRTSAGRPRPDRARTRGTARSRSARAPR